jgi:hypothetical protein
MSQRKPRYRVGQGKATVEELTSRIERALKLLDSETADAIIEKPGEEYAALVQGMEALNTMEWMVMKQSGLRETPRSLRQKAKGMTMALTMVHYAYALGVRRGRESNES